MKHHKDQHDLFQEPESLNKPETAHVIAAYHDGEWHIAEFSGSNLHKSGELLRAYTSQTKPEGAIDTYFCKAKKPGDRIRPSLESVIKVCAELNKRL